MGYPCIQYTLHLEFEADSVADEADVVYAELELLVAKTLAEREQAGEDFARERDHVVFGEGPLQKEVKSIDNCKIVYFSI